MSNEIEKLKSEIAAIQQRNARVEADKAWEVSGFRSLVIAGMTFVVTTLAFYLIQDAYPIRNGVLATVGFVLSIQSLPFIKSWWIKRYYRKNEAT